jgi:hypothetical protein
MQHLPERFLSFNINHAITKDIQKLLKVKPDKHSVVASDNSWKKEI